MGDEEYVDFTEEEPKQSTNQDNKVVTQG